ncbi:glycolate oxidase [Lactobacillus crispatus]|uniref:Glycolate oxidase n=1 Tax=Lactobacillus crispatus TaxID=47770 RepID=A0A120DHQ2_9LACO|nr:alpha-hydroxy-acid oxidizing protein [Lactobacillus crispatus]KWU02823.1 glycolate oxidase [Lactobacillus crispatus]
MSNEKKTDTVSGALETDASSAASMMKKEPEEVKSPWPGPKGMIPVTSGRADDANVHNRAYLDNILVEMRVIDAVEPDLTTTIFGKKYASPLTLAALSHLNKVLPDKSRKPMQEKVATAKKMNVLNWIGMESNEDYREIVRDAGDTVRIVKPYADHEQIIGELRLAEELGAVAVGMDIDHVPGENGKYDVVDGIPLGPITFNDLEEYVKATRLPFVVKGVLSVRDAVKARDAGFDAYKALALGADAVLIGRGILPELLNDGQKGVEDKLVKLNEQLSQMMLYTGIKDTRSFDPTVLHFN